MVEPSQPNKIDLGTLHYEITDQGQVVLHIRLLQNSQLFKQQRTQMQKHLCLIIDDSGSMRGYPIEQVKKHCDKFG